MSDPGDVTRLVLQGRANAQTLEQLRVELLRLARQYGAELTMFQVERDDEMDLLT